MRLHKLYTTEQVESKTYQSRLSLLAAILIIFSLILILRLAYLQFSQYKRYATLSLKNQMSILPIAPPRGIILDRNGVILADNIPIYALEVIPEQVKNMQLTLQKLQQLLPSITDDDIIHFNRAKRQNRSYESIPLKLQLNQEEVAIFASNQYQFTGVTIKARLMRYYPLTDAAAHVVGNVGRINTKELEGVNSINYRATNFIGKTGIEKFYEDTLHGQVGYQQVETDASGRVVRTISKQAPVSGAKLYLTIDSRLQQEAFHALEGNRGSVVVLSTRNGDVLAMASSPSFDPNLFVNGISKVDYQTLSNSPDRPLYNRAVRGQYPPASTVKPFIALAGLEKGAITPETQIYDPGWYRLPGVSHPYRDWLHTGHGVVNLKRALTVSCDTYFYQLGNKIGITAIEDMMGQFGFGRLTHVDLLEEAPGLMPNPSWKTSVKQTHWYPGDTLITAIGQGFMQATPLQLANAVASLSQEGQRFRPHLMAKLELEGGVSSLYKPQEEYPVHLNDMSYWSIVKEGMAAVITANEGTAHPFFRNTPYTLAGKSGTAQVMSGNKYDKVAFDNIPKALRSHSLFIAFAPVENPQIAIAVMMENDKTAKPIARKIMDVYFKLTPPTLAQRGAGISGVNLMTPTKLTNTTEEHHEH
jgi:penicillin-binding protein 2